MEFRKSNQYHRRIDQLTEADKAQIAAEYNRRFVVRRVRRVAKIAIIATRTGATARQRQFIAYKRQALSALLVARQNSYRLAAAGFVLVFALTSIIGPLLTANKTRPLVLSNEVKQLIGDSRDDTKDHLTYDANKKQYSFAVPEETDTANAKHTGRVANAYSLDLAESADDGITVTDTKNKIAMTLKPNFFTAPAKKTEGDHLVYQSGSRQIIYTLKYNGLKEDIIVPKYQGPAMNYEFTLRLPVGVEARLDAEGNIGIYSSDPTLFGTINYGSDEDRIRVEKARENSEKNNLVTTIPYPVVKEVDGTEHNNLARFELSQKKTKQTTAPNISNDLPKSLTSVNEYVLSLKAFNLGDLKYPISLDPTMQVTSSADFAKLNQDENVTIDTTNNLIQRTSLTGGVLGSWTSLANFDTNNATRSQAASGSAPDGTSYIYVIGDRTTDIRYAKINTDGSLSSWASMTVAYPEAIAQASVTSYGGYVYVAGGNLTTNGQLDHVYMGKIQANGIISSWTLTSPLAQAVYMAGSFTYHNRLYLVAGYTNLEVATVQFASINADGTLTSWATTTNAPAARSNAYAAVYNGMAYLVGGDSGPNAPVSTVYGGKINDDGTITTWQTLSSMTTARAAPFVGIYGGYIYAVGGCSAQSAFSCSTFQSSTEYTEIFANGTLGTWRATTAFSTARAHAMGVINNNFIYLIGGCSALDNFLNESCGTKQQTVQSAQIKPAGEVSAWNTTSSFTTGRTRPGVVVYNGFIYIGGGCVTASCGSGDALADVQYATINTNGTIGAWQATSSLTTQRAGVSFAVYQGYLYASGGFNNLPISNMQNSVDVAQINSNGTLGSFATSINTFTTARQLHTSFAYNAFLYVVGGRDANSAGLNSIYRSPINQADGTLGAFVVTTGMSTARGSVNAVVFGNRVYMLGGCAAYTNGSGCSSGRTSIEYAAIAQDGSLSWTTNATSLPSFSQNSLSYITKNFVYNLENSTFRYASIATDGSIGTWTSLSSPADHGGVPFMTGYGETIYILGGTSQGTRVDYAFANNGGPGTISGWTSIPNALTGPRTSATSAVLGGKFWIFGGADGTGIAQSDTQYATINDDGTLSAFTAGPSLLLPRYRHSTALVNNFVYVIAGADDTDVGTSTVQYAKVNADGTLSSNTCNTSQTWCLTSSSYPTICYLQNSGAYNGYIYAFGGGGGCPSNGVKIAHPDATTGDIASWQTSANLPDVRNWGPEVVIYQGYIFLFGGCSTGSCTGANAANLQNTVLVVPINSDGSLGSYRYTSSFDRSRRMSEAVAYNGFVYLLGGDGAGGVVDFAPILSGGNIGVWQTTTTMPVGMLNHSSIQYKGRIYTSGGSNNPSGVYYSNSINSIPRIAQVSKTYDFDTGVKPTKVITRGNKQIGSVTALSYSSSNNASTTLDTTQSYSDIGYTGAAPVNITLGTNRTLSRYLFLRYTVDDSMSALFPDAGNESNITDFDIYYTANPGSRLRGGRTFTNGVDRGLDVQPQ